jgi:hypothetical protein
LTNVRDRLSGRWPPIILGLAGLALGLVIGLVAGGTDTDTTTTTVVSVKTDVQTKTRTVRRVRTVGNGGSKTITRTTGTTTSRRPSSIPKVGADTQNLAGRGSMFLGIIGVGKKSVMRWTTTSNSFKITTNKGTLLNSKSKSGSKVIDKGSYMAFTVVTKGRWTLKVRPLK